MVTMNDVYDRLEDKAGHKLTQVTGMLAGVTTYYCENCGALVQIRNGDLVLFHTPMGSWSSETACKKAGGAVGGRGPSLKEKLDALRDADIESLRARDNPGS